MVEFIIQSIIMFLIGSITDTIWTLYIRHTSSITLEDKRGRRIAGLYSVGTGLCTFLWLEGVLFNKLITVFWICGLYVGTYYAMHIEAIFLSLINKGKLHD